MFEIELIDICYGAKGRRNIRIPPNHANMACLREQEREEVII